MRFGNQRPPHYSVSRSRIGQWLVRTILPFLLGNNRVYVDYDDQLDASSTTSECEFLLAPPSLWPLIKILTFPAFQTGETYRNGKWYLKVGDLSLFLESLYRDKNRAFFRYFRFTYNLGFASFYVRQKLFTKHFTRQSKRHYNVDSDLYEMFLDDEMVYTCAFFESADTELEDAQRHKLDTVIDRMMLPGEPVRILDIGCGWGSLSRRITSSHQNVSYTGISIAKDQIDRAERIDQERLAPEQRSRIEYRLEDYADHQDPNGSGYDGISIIGMMEHVGLGHYGFFLAKICSLLKRDRRAVIHTIVSKRSNEPTNSWIDKHIFHGGYAPSLSEITKAVEACTCKVEAVYVYEPHHYRMTIQHWLNNFERNWATFKEIKLSDWSEQRSDVLFRTWFFYLSAVRNMFAPEAMNFQVAHVVIMKA